MKSQGSIWGRGWRWGWRWRGGGAGVEALLGDLRYIFRGGVVLDMTAGHIYLGS